tara:strand:- start:56 stop:1153 length:1098 start_codon:yes stop_codon:yes gene_type:complete
MGLNEKFFKSAAGGITPSENFNTVLYTGNGGTQSITGVGFQPDFSWIKARSVGYSSAIYDAVRGATYRLVSNTTDASTSPTTNGLTAFNSNGFTLGGGNTSSNGSGTTYVAWNWKAAGFNNDFNVLENGTVTTSSSAATAGITAGSDTVGSGLDVWEVSANRDAGFSIVNYKNTSGDGAVNVGHGLNQEPDMIIQKSTNSSNIPWVVYHKDVGTGKYLSLNSTSSTSTSTGVMSLVNSTSFSSNWSNTSYEFVNYCFHSVDGYQKVGSYVGTGVNAGNFVTTDFEPRFLLVKGSDNSDNWIIVDAARNTSNPRNIKLSPNNADQEATEAGVSFEFSSTGFKSIGDGAGEGQANKVNITYIYLAIA